MKFGKYFGGSLQMLREKVWHSYDKDNIWLSFDALRVTHRVTAVIYGSRYSITLCTPGKLDRLTPNDWDTFSRLGFPVFMYDVTSLQMRRLEQDQKVPISAAQPLPPSDSKTSETENVNQTPSANAASSSSAQGAEADLWKNVPLLSIANL